MLKEQEAEEKQASKPRTSDAGTAPDSAMSPSALYHTQTVTDPPHDILDHMKPLAHAATAPVNFRQPSDFVPPMPSINPVMPPRSKKELKAEEKERKAAQKAQEKEVAAQRKESANKRMEAWRKQEADLAQVMEMSKASAAEEAKKRGEEGPPAVPKEEKGGLSRFARHGSISLRGKPKLFGGKDKDKEGGLPTVPQSAGESTGPETPMSPVDDKAKKNRFSLGRKKSNAFM
jgi:ubiquitin carboxyl-terminal hydrolase 9/13